MLKQPVVVIGMGEMGSVFARGFLRSGHPVFPVTRDMDMNGVAAEIETPELVVVAVAEGDLHSVLQKIPQVWRDRLVLLQNELLPRDWQQHGLIDPTVVSVWFEKKKGMDSKVIIPSPAYGPHAEVLHAALGSIDIPVAVVSSPDDLLYELILKNVYILTTNIAGLEVGGNVGELWRDHQQLARDVAADVMDIQSALTGVADLPRERLIEGMVDAFDGDIAHNCMGRSAPARLQRALHQADEAGVEVPTLRRIAKAQ